MGSVREPMTDRLRPRSPVNPDLVGMQQQVGVQRRQVVRQCPEFEHGLCGISSAQPDQRQVMSRGQQRTQGPRCPEYRVRLLLR